MKDSTLLPISIFLSAIILSGSIVYHAERLAGGGASLLGNKNTTTTNTVVNPDNPTIPTEPQGPVIANVSIDDDPVLGDKDAPVTIIEFSDYECPFCQRHFKETYSQLKENYIDTGKVRLVFRDLPLSFHDPMATKAAIAANCVRDQAGDTGYFAFHDLWYANTMSNGQGLSEDKLKEYAAEAGANADTFMTCVTEERFKDEVQGDLAMASQYGASATPSFFIGKSAGADEFEAELLVGAQPYSAFQAKIDSLLAE